MPQDALQCQQMIVVPQRLNENAIIITQQICVKEQVIMNLQRNIAKMDLHQQRNSIIIILVQSNYLAGELQYQFDRCY